MEMNDVDIENNKNKLDVNNTLYGINNEVYTIESIEDIYVHEGKEITIKFKYEDEYQRAIEYIKRNKNLTLLRNEEEIG